jgi:hypothetical protein
MGIATPSATSANFPGAILIPGLLNPGTGNDRGIGKASVDPELTRKSDERDDDNDDPLKGEDRNLSDLPSERKLVTLTVI